MLTKQEKDENIIHRLYKFNCIINCPINHKVSEDLEKLYCLTEYKGSRIEILETKSRKDIILA